MDIAGTPPNGNHGDQDSRSTGLLKAVAQILGPDGQVAGVGFLVAEGVLMTCAHVVRAAGAGPGDSLRVAFPHGDGAPEVEGLVSADAWRAPETEDVAVVRLSTGDDVTRDVTPLALSSAAGSRGHRVQSYGFPTQAPTGGHFGYGKAGGILPATQGRGAHLQLTEANDLTTGFSGGPVIDEVTGLVIGMLTEITAPDEHERGQNIAYVTPTEVLREILPELTEQDVYPYRGLEPFTAAHAQWFQGRKDAVRQVLANLAEQQRVTLLLGPSGSGKSSLVQAGVLPALAAGELPGSDRWLPIITRPRQDLLAELERDGLPGADSIGIAEAVTRRLTAEPGHQRVVLVIDQYEELLAESLTSREQERHLAATGQITAAITSHADLSVIMIMRDDFYPQQAALAPELLKAATPGLLNVPSTLSQDDLHDIITLPALKAGAHFEQGLPEHIIADVLASTPDGMATRRAPVTVLPMLELTLDQLWQRRRDGYLTHQAYQRIGGVTGSLTTWCDTALNQLPADQRPIAQRILTSLVRPADPSHGIPATRALIPLAELRDLAAGPDAAPDGDNAVGEVISVLTRHRIITTQTLRNPKRPAATPGLPVAELIHDALVRDWGTLRDWVNQDRRFQVWLDLIRLRATHWAADDDPGNLLGGAALAEALEWSLQRRLPGDIAAFITASRQRQQAVAWRSRRLNAILAALLVLALVAAGAAWWQWRTVDTERQSAVSRQLAAESSRLIDTNPDLASLLAIQAYRTSHTPEAVASLQDAAALPLHRSLVGHRREVYSVAFSPDGRTLATASTDHTARLWDLANSKTRTTLVGHRNEVWDVAFSPDGRTLATASTDNTARLWDVATGKTRAVLTGHTDVVWAVAFSPDGRTLATGSKDRTARLWAVATAKTRTTFTGHTNAVWAVAFSPDGRTLATGSADNTARLWALATSKPPTILTGHTDSAWALAFSPDGRTLASGSSDQTARLWDVATGKTRATFVGHTGAVDAVAFSPDGRTLATASDDKTARLWALTTGRTRTIFAGHRDAVGSVAFSPDGRTLATGSTDRTARLWDVATGRTRSILTGHTAEVDSVAFSPDGRTLATGSSDYTARLWDVATGKKRAAFTGHTDSLWAVAFSPDGRTLATGSSDSTARLWDVATGKTRTTIDVAHGSPFAATSVAFGPDGRTFATGVADSTARLWDAATGKAGATFTGHTNTVYSVAFSPDGRTLATASADRTTRLWDVTTGKTRTILTGHTDVVWSVAFSPDGRTLATASADNTARLWDVATGRSRAVLSGHTDQVDSLAFSPDQHSLATASLDGTVRLWDLALPEPSAAIRMICRSVNRDLTAEEREIFLPGDSADPVCSQG
ncbi:trypsin-like peptidase domain-containing protein [Streptomyces sp. NPDC032472]|uniref:nSTAND1 domain-containing NTPase n=1 Tax=Streptomyces sp. NPDC032472 TaxID=3155018 RepID=UPI0033E32A42